MLRQPPSFPPLGAHVPYVLSPFSVSRAWEYNGLSFPQLSYIIWQKGFAGITKVANQLVLS